MGVSRGLIGLFIGELFTAADGIGYIITLAGKTFNSARTYGDVAHLRASSASRWSV